MSPDRFRQIEQIYLSALDQDPARRTEYLAAACAADESLRREVESMLAAHGEAGTFLLSPAPGVPDQHTAGAAAGQRLGHYQIISLLGAGGMGEVWLAEDTRLRRRVALKLLPAHLTREPERVRRFEQEALAISALNHPNIITLHEIGEDSAGAYLVMEHVQGRTLRALAAEPAALASLWTWGVQMARALGAAHAAGIVHRDIKPENIMVRDDGYVKILDFGLARLTAEHETPPEAATLIKTNPGALLGTVKYMSPEQARGEQPGAATDIFSLGVVLYELATGRHPFPGASMLGVLQAITSETPAPPARLNTAIPAPITALILRMLEKDARARPAAREVETALEEIAREPGGALRELNMSGAMNLSSAPPRRMVGRAREWDELRQAWLAARDGRGLLFCVAGEPGLGKTTLIESFLAEINSAPMAAHVARGRCSERLAGSEAWLPLLDALDSLLRDDPDGARARVMRQIAPTWYAQVASLGDDNSAAARLLEEIRTASRERMKRELAALLETLSQQRPLLVFLDDLHWADVSTIDMLGYLAGGFGAMRLLLVVTYRPSEMLLAGHPFLQIRPDLQARGLCRELPLGFLDQQEIAAYLALEFPGHRFPAELPRLIHAKTEGSPLFMADLVRYMRDRGVIANTSGSWALEQTLPDLERELPESVRGMIERKIAQLGEDDRRLLTAASVQGYEFDSAVVARALKLDPDAVEERLEKLEQVYAFVQLTREAEFPDHTLTLGYRFIHVLYQNALYAALRVTRRAALSREVALALESFHGAQAAAVTGELAILWESAREPARAAPYFLLGAQQAMEIFATHEAGQLARRGLALLLQTPETEERQRRELSLQVILGNFFLSTRGLAATETAVAYDRVRELSQQTGDTQHMLPMLYGQAIRYVFRPAFDEALTVSGEFAAIARQRQDPTILIGDRLIGTVHLFRGELPAASAYLEKCLAVYDPALHQSLAWRYGSEPGVLGYSLRALTRWLRGWPDQALADSAEAMRLSAAIPHAHTAAFALMYAGMLRQFLRSPQEARELSGRQISLCEEHGLTMLQAMGSAIEAWALAEQGGIAEGIAGIHAGMDRMRATGAGLFRAPYYCVLAGLYGKAGQPDAGFAALAEAQTAVEQHAERWWEAELHRQRGELLRQSGAAFAEAEASLQKALAIARRQEAKSLELRAAMSLMRLSRQHGHAAAARPTLAGIYDWFTEGFETVDLREARALLDEPPGS
ncbi:MAG: protein kinase domain-containing protein [Blastocatellia bacterium]